MSSNESFILMMKQVPNTKVVGMKSFGSSGNPVPIELSNGIKIYLPSWQAYTLDGKLIEGNGINPDIEIITTKDGEKIDFYIHRFKTGDDSGLSYPHATAYYVGDKYIVEFDIATELSGEAGQEEEINSLRTSLESFSKVK